MKRFISVVAKRRAYPLTKVTFAKYSGESVKHPSGTAEDLENLEQEYKEYSKNAKYIFADASDVPEELRFRHMLWFLKGKLTFNSQHAREKSEQDISFLHNFHASEMASFQQRSIVEKLFGDCIRYYNSLVEEEKEMCMDNPKTSALEEAAKRHFETKTLPNFQDEKFIKMCHVDWLLMCDEIRSVLFEKIGLGDVKYPVIMDEKFLMGCLSYNDYHMFIKTVYVANDDDDDMKNLFKAFTKTLRKDVQEYDRISAFGGKELIRTSNIQLTRLSPY